MTELQTTPPTDEAEGHVAVVSAGPLEWSSDRALLEVRDLHVSFRSGRSTVRAVDGVSFAIPKGKTLGLIGESGSGKSVTARSILGLLPPARTEISGSIRFDGDELIGRSERALSEYRGKEIALVLQDPTRSLNPTIQIGKQIVEAIRLHESDSREVANARARELLERVRLPSPAQRFFEYPHQLSGGMRQRVVIAIALSCSPRLLIADEATTALDVTTQAQIMDLLADLQDELGMAMLMISHDIALAAAYADEVAVMYAGRIVEQAPSEELFRSVEMPYTKALLEAVPRRDRPPHERLRVVPGVPPDPSRPLKGCAFAKRCPLVEERCHLEAPLLVEHRPGHAWACFHTSSTE